MMRTLAMALLLVACEPRVPSGSAGLSLKFVVAGEDSSARVVYFRIEPSLAEPEAWAVDARDGFPASRTVWLPVSGTFRVIAAGFECPEGCTSVDPWSDLPVVTGRGLVELREGRVSSLTLLLQGTNCGDGAVDPGEACDSGPGCSDSCRMEVTTLVVVPGSQECGIAALDDGGETFLAWLDGSCGVGDSGCVCTTMLGPDGTWGTVVRREAQGVGCALATDHDGAVSWFGAVAPTEQAEILTMSAHPGESVMSLGPVDPARMDGPGLSQGSDVTRFALAVEGDDDTLELRWLSGAGGIGSAAVMDVRDDEFVGSPSVLAVQRSGDLLIAAVWSHSAAGEHPRWMLSRWSCAVVAGECVPVPLETEPIDIALAGLIGESVRLSHSLETEPMALVSTLDGNIAINEFAFPGPIAQSPSAVIHGLVGGSGKLVDLDSDPEAGLLLLTMIPVAGSDGCMATLTRVSGTSNAGEVELGSWGGDGGLGCNGSVAFLDEDRALVVFRSKTEISGVSELSWIVVSLDVPFR